MPGPSVVCVSRKSFREDRHGRTFVDVLDDAEQPFDAVLAFFSCPQRQRRMEESELHHDRPPLAGVVRELEDEPAIDRFLATEHPRRTKRLRQAIGVVVRMIMEERLGADRQEGIAGCAGNPALRSTAPGSYHNTGGLAFWFLRAERYRRVSGMPYRSVKVRSQETGGKSPAKVSRQTRVAARQVQQRRSSRSRPRPT